MAFKYQCDSFFKMFTSTVVSCTESQLITSLDGKEQALSGYEVIQNDTILFPEGGGQSDDHGVINNKNVLCIKQVDGRAVHFVDKPLAIGKEAQQKVEWKRFMQHI